MELGVVLVSTLVTYHKLFRAAGIYVSQFAAVVAQLVGEAATASSGSIGMLLPAVVGVVVVVESSIVGLNSVVALQASCRFFRRQDVGPLIDQVIDIGPYRQRHRIVDLLLEKPALHDADEESRVEERFQQFFGPHPSTLDPDHERQVLLEEGHPVVADDAELQDVAEVYID